MGRHPHQSLLDNDDENETTMRPCNSVIKWKNVLSFLRGGGGGDVDDPSKATMHQIEDEDDDDDDEERYSRQVYTMGARAHALVRQSTVYLDGPLASGLLYECAKNLALSGVGTIIIVTSDDEDEEREDNKQPQNDSRYHIPELDDLGQAYLRAARAEIGVDSDTNSSLTTILLEFIQRLNPSVQVKTITKTNLLLSLTQEEVEEKTAAAFEQADSDSTTRGQEQQHRRVLLVVDRPQSVQVEWNQACRLHHLGKQQSQPSNTETTTASFNPMYFVSVSSLGVYGMAFCDFGRNFQVHDVDGESPLVIPLDRVVVEKEQVSNNNKNNNRDNNRDNVVSSEEQVEKVLIMVYCMEGERHDVSKGDVIQFDLGGASSSSSADRMWEPLYEVQHVFTPSKFSIAPFFKTTPTATTSSVDENESAMLLEAAIRQSSAPTVSRKKMPITMDFVSMQEALDACHRPERSDGLFTPCDLDKSFDPVRRHAILTSFAAWERQTSRSENSDDDGADFDQLAREIGANDDDGDDNDGSALMVSEKAWKDLVHRFGKCAAGKVTPVQAIMGAIGAQEALKAISGLYNPIQQFLLYDCDEVLLSTNPDDDDNNNDSVVPPSSGHRHVLGDSLCDEFANQSLFVVGSGAIGCEIMKNLAAMGAGTGSVGRIIVTDMDTIEKSNLSRQLLFRDGDIGKFKSVAAEAAVSRFNSQVRIDVHTSKVGGGEDGPFHDSFWAKDVDIILNALDNVEARLYMDGQCVTHTKALIDAGTLGSKGNVQVVVPHQSESYGSSVDPPEPAIPVCTLKNFPYAIAHTIQWARDLFEGYYERRPKQANMYGPKLRTEGTRQVAEELTISLGKDAARQAAEELKEDLSLDMNDIDLSDLRQSSIAWAVTQAKTLFHDTVTNLLEEHPLDSQDEDGEPFWSGNRRIPTALSFSQSENDSSMQETVNKNLVDFVMAAARLRIESLMPPFSEQESTQVSPEEARVALLESTTDRSTSNHAEDEDNESVESLLRSIEHSPTYSEVEFEKDDDKNGHVAFVTAASNLRAMCFGITPVDAMETRRVAGRIVPAMITTTAFVSALSCLELIKIVQGVPLMRHRNAFINLALPFFAFTAPIPAEEIPGLRGTTYTQWDRITIKETKKAAAANGITFKSFLSRILKHLRTTVLSSEESSEDEPFNEDSLSISTVSFGPYLLYANFLHGDDSSLLNRPLWDVLEETTTSSGEDDEDEFAGREGDEFLGANEQLKLPQRNQTTFLDFTVVVEDLAMEEEVELPPVRLLFRPYLSE